VPRIGRCHSAQLVLQHFNNCSRCSRCSSPQPSWQRQQQLDATAVLTRADPALPDPSTHPRIRPQAQRSSWCKPPRRRRSTATPSRKKSSSGGGERPHRKNGGGEARERGGPGDHGGTNSCCVNQTRRAQPANSTPIGHRLITQPQPQPKSQPQPKPQPQPPRKIPIESYKDGPDGLKYFDMQEGTGALAQVGQRVAIVSLGWGWGGSGVGGGRDGVGNRSERAGEGGLLGGGRLMRTAPVVR